MNTERLNKLREAVVNAPLGKFNMGKWVCHTQACAAGWYVKQNPDCGLVLVKDRGIGDIATAGNEKCFEVPSLILAEHFGITQEQARELFIDWDSEEDDTKAQKEEFLGKLDRLEAGTLVSSR